MDKNEPAFPATNVIVPQPGHYFAAPENSPGMTLRDYFAAKAMAAMLSTDYRDDGKPWALDSMHQSLAVRAYQIADAMLAARQQEDGNG